MTGRTFADIVKKEREHHPIGAYHPDSPATPWLHKLATDRLPTTNKKRGRVR